MGTRSTIELERLLIESSETGAGVPAILDAAVSALGRRDDTRSWGAVFAERETGHDALQLSSHARPDRVERVLQWMRRDAVRHLVVDRANETLSPDGGAWTKVCAAVGGSLPGERLTVVLCWAAEEVSDRRDEELIRAARFAAAVIGPRCSLHVPVEAPLDVGSELVFEGSAVGMVLADLSGRIRRVNRTARAMLGRGPDDLLGKPWTDLVDDEDKVRLHMACADVVMGLRQSPRIEARFVRAGGEALWGAATVSMLSDRDQRPWNMVVVLEDLTQQRGASAHVEQARAQFRSIFEQAPVGMVDASPEGVIRSANRQFCEMLGYTELELVGRGWKSITDPEDIAANLARRERAVAERESPYSLEKRYVTKDGRSVPALVHVSVVRDTRGEVESLFAIIEDLTEKRQLAAQLVQTAKMESLGRLAGGIAHDFGNLLAAISGSADLACAEIAAENRARALERLGEVRSATQSATRLTRQLLSFARRESLSAKAVLVAPICERVGVMLRRLLPLGIKVRLELGDSGEGWRARGEAGQIEQIVLNLAINARDAIEAPGVVTIAVSNERVGSRKKGASAVARGITAGDWVRISVSDTGSGISAEDLPRIFEPLYTTKRSGFGLGLANVYSMVKQWGGDVQVTSKLGRGSRFDVWLPRAGPELALAENSEPASETMTGEVTHVGEGNRRGVMTPGGASSTRERPLALVVDDQPEIRDLVRIIFERAGYRVKVAIDGREGIGLIRAHAEELARDGVVLTDQRLPHADGLEVAAVCREVSPGTAVVLCSGDTTAVEVEAKALGVRLLPKSRLVLRSCWPRCVLVEEAWPRAGRCRIRSRVTESPPTPTPLAAESVVLPLSILCLDDDDDFRQYVRSILGPDGHDVRTAATPEEFFAAAEQRAPDVVLLDMKMGRWSGEDVLAEIRRRWRGMCVIVVTGHPTMGSMRQTFKQDVFDYIAKPFSVEELRRSLRQAAETFDLGQRPLDRLKQSLGRLIRLARTEKGWTLKELGEASQVSVSQLSSVERGAHLPSLESLVAIAAALDLKAGEWLTAAGF